MADAPAAGATALLVVDLISTWDFEDAEALVRGAVAIAARIGALKRRCRAAGVPAIYVNDNHGRWRSDFRRLVELSESSSPTGARIAQHLRPEDCDYSVLKPKHSAFFATPLDLLLRHLRATKLLVTGISADQCILLTASEARMHDYEVVVPRDCTATQTAARKARALAQLDIMEIRTTPSSRLRLPGHAPRQGAAIKE
ncbi:MAG: cysteine hydrolase family protein [Caldimonas sp.]